MNATADQLLDRIAVVVRGNLPPGVTPAYLDGFLTRHRPTLVSVLERNLARRRRGRRPAPVEAPPELWTASKRTAANLAAMRVAASTPADQLTAADRRMLAGYSGWGAGQLETEMEEGSWSITDASRDFVFGDEEALWKLATKQIADDVLIRGLGIKHVPDEPWHN